MNDNFYAMSFSRFISGFFQVFLTIYIPLYCDCFGTSVTKPYMLSLILLAGPLGLVTGFGCTGALISYGVSWRYSFFVQGITMLGGAIMICMFPSRFININECIRLKREAKDFRNKQLYQTRRNQQDGEIGGTHQFQPKVINEINEQTDNQSTSQQSELMRVEEADKEVAELSQWAQLKILLKNVPYMCCVGIISILFFVISGI